MRDSAKLADLGDKMDEARLNEAKACVSVNKARRALTAAEHKHAAARLESRKAYELWQAEYDRQRSLDTGE